MYKRMLQAEGKFVCGFTTPTISLFVANKQRESSWPIRNSCSSKQSPLVWGKYFLFFLIWYWLT